ncbi:MAG TPA: anthranilate synthase component I [Bryobacteraceae bacterium]|nr:anthranilate synthase component I [Bryobacteraceae bacterium]
MPQLQYTSRSGIGVTRRVSKVPYSRGLEKLLGSLDSRRGIYLSSGYEYPGRYSRWDVASLAPPLEIVSFGRNVRFSSLNARGEKLLGMLAPVLAEHPHWEHTEGDPTSFRGTLKPLPELFPEEERSKQPSVFSILRHLMQEFAHPSDPHLALVGAFGFDLLFQFDPIELKLPRGSRKDLHLFLCDDLFLMDRKREQIERYQYDFTKGDQTTEGLPRDGETITSPRKNTPPSITSDHAPEEYMAKVEKVREGMRQGDYYEVVLRQTFSTPFTGKASELFRRVQKASPSPYEFFLQLGDEQLIGASPEMFVRVEGDRVETCPISGTAIRTGDPLKDAESIRELLNSRKEESELTMCTDVDRNDKSRVCIPGSVQVIGRRLIESYAGVFHTVDHVEGTLQPGFDSLDAFLAHMWAVTVIGAPKKAAAQAIENLEKSARGWYGGAVGMLSMNGDVNTGILIRTVHLRDGIAEYPVGATLLYDSVPELEERETRLKATGFFRALRQAEAVADTPKSAPDYSGIKILMVDNDDCFIHTLSNYVRQTGAQVVTYRAGFPVSLLDEVDPDLVLISPGPGRPSDFGLTGVIREAASREIPIFGVCLGLQGVVEAFGGELGVLDYPMHGKPSTVTHQNAGIFEGLPASFQVGRYHSLFARKPVLPEELEVTAESEDGVVMGIRHKSLPIEAVQFHPESLLSLNDECGLRLIQNVLRLYGVARKNAALTGANAADRS